MFSEEKKDCEVLGKAKRPSELKEILERSIKEKDSNLGLLRDCGHPHIQQQQAAPQLVQKQTQMLGKKVVQSAKGHEIELFLVEFQAIFFKILLQMFFREISLEILIESLHIRWKTIMLSHPVILLKLGEGQITKSAGTPT